MHDNEYERLMLIAIIEDFVKFAQHLLRSGKITDELYDDITVNKIKFLQEAEIHTKGLFRRHS